MIRLGTANQDNLTRKRQSSWLCWGEVPIEQIFMSWEDLNAIHHEQEEKVAIG